MKRICNLLLCTVLSFGMIGCSSDLNDSSKTKNDNASNQVKENASNQTSNETESKAEDKQKEKTKEILLNESGYLIEFRGIEEYSSESWIVNLYVENNTDSEICVSLNEINVDGYSIKIANNGNSIQPGTKYLAEPLFDYVLNVEDLKAYEMTELKELNFTLWIGTSLFGDTIVEKPVTLTINKHIE